MRCAEATEAQLRLFAIIRSQHDEQRSLDGRDVQLAYKEFNHETVFSDGSTTQFSRIDRSWRNAAEINDGEGEGRTKVDA